MYKSVQQPLKSFCDIDNDSSLGEYHYFTRINYPRRYYLHGRFYWHWPHDRVFFAKTSFFPPSPERREILLLLLLPLNSASAHVTYLFSRNPLKTCTYSSTGRRFALHSSYIIFARRTTRSRSIYFLRTLLRVFFKNQNNPSVLNRLRRCQISNYLTRSIKNDF